MWYVARINSGTPKLAQHHLFQAGFVTFDPRIEYTVVERGRMTVKTRSMFIGYLFLSLPNTRRHGEIRNMVGVVDLLPVGSENPTPLPDGFVDALQEVQPMRLEEAEKIVKVFST